jgi:2-polyprenyl-6-methoxyphenol hydroxylase-like FAD-dependent oxidoreductase
VTTALIVGGGIAGPVMAMALHRVRIESVVYEAHPEPAEDVGSYLTVAPNGLDALRALDAHAGVRSAGFPTRQVVLWSGTSQRLGQVPLAGARADGLASITIKRARTERSLRWMHDHHIDWDVSVAGRATQRRAFRWGQ